MKKLFVTYEIAKRLKEKGFNKQCLGFYSSFDTSKEVFRCRGTEKWPVVSLSSLKGGSELTPAPTYSQVIDWFRDDFIYFIEEPHRESNPAYWLVRSFCEKEGPYLLDVAIEKALTSIK